ncbi:MULTISPECIES: TRAP transporter large permease [Anaerotruncus]|jgi:C4-dicarboxylate transporter DctM subunit|uniref:TRAP transporter large permease n=1 Tax=Anaerotruncus TaxID=244127 RepID=UPI000E541E8E|nr:MULTISPECIES: TRAP transporter large permease [Anaerotruncus]RGX54889.1 TRAP transporter large permease [Anaerotruncus sp. AF02-27]
MLAVCGGLFFCLLIFGAPIFIAMLIPCLAALTMNFPGMDMGLAVQRMVGGIDTFSLLSIPFFMFAADIMSKGDIGHKLVNFANKLVGHLPGGLAITTVVTCTIFGAISGAGPAAIVAIGMILYPALCEQGYEPGRAIGCITSSSTLAMLIPPGIAMILYGVSSGASVGKLFMSGLSVGVLVAVIFSIYVCIDAIRHKIPRQRPATFKEVLKATRDAFWALGLPVIILVGIYAGVMTPTEAAAIAVAYVLVIELFIYRSVSFKEVFEIGITSGRMVAMIFILIGSGSLLSWILTAAQIPQSIVTLTQGAPAYMVLIIINVIFLVAGMFMDPNSIVIVLTPLVYPLGMAIGIDPIHLGMIIVLNCAIGMLTPPFGLNIFVSIGTFNTPYDKVVRPLWPYILMMLGVLLLVNAFPAISLWLPNTMQ